MEPGRQAFLESELERIKERVKRDWHAAEYIRDELGLPDLPPIDTVFGGGGGAEDGGPHSKVPVGADVAASVNPGEFAGKSSTAATRMLLQKVGQSRPLKINEIFAALKKGGVQIGSSQALYRSLTRSTEFCKPVRGRWGLSEWYSPTALKKMRQAGGDDADDGVEDDSSAGADDASVVEGGEEHEVA
jgi:hypothetical protein